MTDRLKIAGISYINARPYFVPLVEKWVSSNFDFSMTTPVEANRMLGCGTAVAGLISSVEWLRLRNDMSGSGLIRIPGLDIASDGSVQSILLFSDCSWEELSVVAVTKESATSVSLLEAIFRLDNRELKLVSSDDPLQELSGGDSDGALLIGDAAIDASFKKKTGHKFDLGQIWKDRTGLPMVYAVVAVRREYRNLIDPIRDVIRESLTFSRSNLKKIIQPIETRLQSTAPEFDPYDYLERFDRARSHPDLEKGLDLFAQLAGIDQAIS